MALTGTPLINDVEDFHAIWRFLGWIKRPLTRRPPSCVMRELEETGLTPADRGFYPEARKAVIDMGIVRRRKVDVAKDLPDKRVADIPVELDDEAARSIRASERELAKRLLVSYRRCCRLATSRPGPPPGAAAISPDDGAEVDASWSGAWR